ncbi:hypothetical protein [Sphingomonas sp.]|uniref:hypothetical protein n=1 Tax=Sphingomonas sp. TaxID=28214 RepID=UPI00286B034E|nr:hypothetical protein [Sphingomonas sp.]
MTRFILAAGVAALAIAASAGAKPGGGGGGGDHGGGNGDHAAQSQSDGGGQHGGGGSRAQNGGGEGGGGFKAANVDRHGGGQRFANFDRGGHGGGNGGKGHAFKSERQAFKADRHVNGFAGNDRGNRRDVVRDLRGDNRFDSRIGDRFASRGLIDGCPPGLAKKHNGCMPPGQLKNSLLGRVIPVAYRNGIVPLGLQDLYGDTPNYYYRYGDGNMYRVNRSSNLIEALLPLLGGGYAAGQQFPSSYMNSYVPSYYQSFYPDSSDNYYRYANGNVYGIDPYSGMIDNVIPMYDSGYGYGQMLPPSYSYYNVPYQYRSMYYDTSDYSYRYAPGAIYQVDRSSNLITAVASLLAGDIGVGNRLPEGYSAYNVPLSYRSQYYDTADNWYRYNDGYIYRVDPTTQLVTSVINALV